ncbi:carbohydrate kinase family protein [Streptomyces sp. AS02]|uniref:carbohydrate kinase family protein n=1 Tax=Streptomyces sp. AS02 TaxID=2938946 RepID=UPI002021C6F2|nr:carbohydrate kinase family protein [Streptomyces sp. AS02]MCL8014938.1 carbohydrate kinase family protein [Streptomyces sp. AS02]
MDGRPTIVALGAHVLDTLVLPVEQVPDGQGGVLVDRIAVSAAGTAGATALVLARLGARAVSVGAVGDDAMGELLVSLLGREGVDTRFLRRSELPTSASVLPIRRDGSRPAFHQIGANAVAARDVPWDMIEGCDHLHLGAPELFGEDAVRVLRFARDHGVTTSADCLAPGLPDFFPMIEPWLPLVDHFLPNSEQACGWTQATDVAAAARRLRELGAGCTAVTDGAGATVVATPAGEVLRVPVFQAEVIDTSGCGDAFSAGYIRGLTLGHGIEQATVLGAAVAAQVVAGLGSDHGDYDLQSVTAFAEKATRLPV